MNSITANRIIERAYTISARYGDGVKDGLLGLDRELDTFDGVARQAYLGGYRRGREFRGIT